MGIRYLKSLLYLWNRLCVLFSILKFETPFLLHGAPPAACPAGGVFVQSRACRHIHTEVFSISRSQERLISSFNFSPTLFSIRRHTVSCSDGSDRELDLKYSSPSPKSPTRSSPKESIYSKITKPTSDTDSKESQKLLTQINFLGSGPITIKLPNH